MIETPNLGPITISQHVVKHFSKLCGGDIDKALDQVTDILKGSQIERLEVPAMIASFMTSKGDDPEALEFWVHRDSSTMFLVKPAYNCKLVEMAMKHDMEGFKFNNA